jgi:hypothetical protein
MDEVSGQGIIGIVRGVREQKPGGYGSGSHQERPHKCQQTKAMLVSDPDTPGGNDQANAHEAVPDDPFC